MLKFTKGLANQNGTSIKSNYTKPNDLEKLEKIRSQMKGNINNFPKTKMQEIEVNKSIYQDRINALKNIKKD